MKLLITGANGQLGQALQRAQAMMGGDIDILAVSRAELDIGDADAVAAFVDAAKPDLLINAAAYTAVDKAESDIDAAFRINGDAVGYLSRAASAVGASHTSSANRAARHGLGLGPARARPEILCRIMCLPTPPTCPPPTKNRPRDATSSPPMGRSRVPLSARIYWTIRPFARTAPRVRLYLAP